MDSEEDQLLGNKDIGPVYSQGEDEDEEIDDGIMQGSAELEMDDPAMFDDYGDLMEFEPQERSAQYTLMQA